jgi:hypothetical protein
MAKKTSGKTPKKSTKGTKTQKTKSTGLGDSVEKVFKATGIDKAAKWLLGEDCGCSDRREVLNSIFPYQKPNCLTEDEHSYLSDYFNTSRTKIDSIMQKELVKIYNRVFNDNARTTNCTPCFVNNIHKKLERVFKEYQDER